MMQPDGFDDGSGRVCSLSKSIYGLRQASKCWYNRFDEYLKSIGFNSCPYEKCLYYSFQNDSVTYLLLYVDDLIIAGNNLMELSRIQTLLNKEFEMSKVSSLDDTTFIGLDISRDRAVSYTHLTLPTIYSV